MSFFNVRNFLDSHKIVRHGDNNIFMIFSVLFNCFRCYLDILFYLSKKVILSWSWFFEFLTYPCLSNILSLMFRIACIEIDLRLMKVRFYITVVFVKQLQPYMW